jgi:hypothetical protein
MMRQYLVHFLSNNIRRKYNNFRGKEVSIHKVISTTQNVKCKHNTNITYTHTHTNKQTRKHARR